MAAYRLPAMSKARPRGPFNPDAKTVTLPFGANWYICAQASDTNMSPGLAWLRVGSSVAIAPSNRAALSIIVFMCVFSLLFLLRNFAGEGSRKSFRHGKSSECCSRGKTFGPEDSLFTPQRY